MTPTEHEVRIQKLHELNEAGVVCYPEKFTTTQSIEQLHAIGEHATLPTSETLIEQGASAQYAIAGRMMTYRTHGKLSFAHLQDVTGKLQLCLVRDKILYNTGKAVVNELTIAGQTVSAYKLFEKYLDLGDILGVSGELFVTKHGELTLFVSEFQLLTKALLPLPEKWHGLKDADDRLRKRYLDIIMNNDVKTMVQRRGIFRQSMRSFLLDKGFLEVDTPILEVTTGGADANPFATHHNALDLDVFLRISCGELRQKRLMVAGLEKTFEIGRVFRNEGMSPEHAQDYMQMEVYWSYADYQDMMQLVRDLYLHIIDRTYGTRKFTIRGFEVDFDQEWELIDYSTIIQQQTGVDIATATDNEIEQQLHALQVSFEAGNRPRLIDSLWKYCRKSLSGPAFLINVPTAVSPLAKAKLDNPALTNRFQVIIAGSEVGNGFSELNDPIDQKARFDEQQALRDAGDEEAQMADYEYVEALMHGMPPAAGFGVSERLFCFLENLPIREAQIFPLMKPAQTRQHNQDKAVDLADYGELPSIDQAVDLMQKYLQDTYQHCKQVGHVMHYFAEKLGQPTQLRHLAGLLHDIDRDHIGKEPTSHLGTSFESIVGEIDLPSLLVDDIKSHYYEQTEVPVDSLLRKYLASVDELTGFVYAYSLMRPTGLEDMQPKSVIKKIKDKSFAAGVNREHLKHCEQFLNIPLAEFVADIIEALQTYSG